MSKLKKQFEDLCNKYVEEFCRLYGMEFDVSDVWVGDDVGSIACIGDNYFDFNNVIKYAVDNQLSDYDDLMDWYYYTMWACEYNQTVPNFKSWSRGCPRFSKEEQQRLVDMKKNLENMIRDYKEKY